MLQVGLLELEQLCKGGCSNQLGGVCKVDTKGTVAQQLQQEVVDRGLVVVVADRERVGAGEGAWPQQEGAAGSLPSDSCTLLRLVSATVRLMRGW